MTGIIDGQRGVFIHASCICLPTKVEGLKLSQEDKPQTHSLQWKIMRRFGISLALVNTIIKNDCVDTINVSEEILTGTNKLSIFNSKTHYLGTFKNDVTGSSKM